MRNNKNIQQPETKFVTQIMGIFQEWGKDTFIDLNTFFTDHFLLAADHDIFDDEEYRVKWATHLGILRDIAHACKQHSSKDIDRQIEAVQELLAGKEVSHD